ncbi:MAG: hypothetical protein FWH20_04550 [Oscillospiraceae bacterium]|nr:hypothetical protein [Oscillospiraceae bacterium]
MKKPLITIAIILISTACTNNTALSDEVAELNNKIEEIRAINSELLDEINNPDQDETADDFQIKNVVVEKPVQGQVTNEISEKLIGKYSVEKYPDIYFEIREDGTMEISLFTFSGMSVSTEEDVRLIAHYTDIRVRISFVRVRGNYTFPGSFLTLEFEGDPECKNFVIKSPLAADGPPDEILIFVKEE